MSHRPRKTFAVLAAALVLGLAACSSATPQAAPSSTSPSSTTTTTAAAPTAKEILAKAKSHAQAATSGAYQGTLEDSGTTMEVSYRGSADGSNAETKLKVGKDGQATIVTVGGKTYVSGDSGFWATAGAPSPGAGKFVEVPAAEAPSAGLELSGILDAFFAEVAPGDLSTQVGEEKVGGVDAWVLSDKDGKDKGTLHVAKETFEVLRLFASEGGAGQLEFSDWNGKFEIKAPAAGDIVQLQ